MAALRTSCTDLSSRTSASLRATFACGKVLMNAAVRSGSLAYIETNSPPPRMMA
jgi:hypothetical protein